jgi:hypothetical protein
VDSIQFVDGQEVFELRESPFDAELIAYFVEVLFIPLANGVTFGIRVSLINRNELGSKPKSYDGNIDFSHGSVSFPSVSLWQVLRTKLLFKLAFIEEKVPIGKSFGKSFLPRDHRLRRLLRHPAVATFEGGCCSSYIRL